MALDRALWATVALAIGVSQAPKVEIAIVANAEAGTVTLVDVATRTVVGTVDVNPAHTKAEGPGRPNYAQDTDVSPDGRTLYVSRGYMGDVAAIDIATGALRWHTPLNTLRADHMTLSPDGRFIYVSAMLDNRVYQLSASDGKIARHMVTGVFPHDNKISKDGRLLYNTSIGQLAGMTRPAGSPPLADTPGYPFQITIADAKTLEIRERIQTDNGIRPWQFAPGERVMYAQLSNEHVVVAYDLQSRKVTRKLELPVKPGVTKADWDFEAPHHGLALTADGATLCLAGRASDYAALVSAPDLKLITTIATGDGPGWSEVSDDGRTCFVANSRSDDLSVISIPDRREVARLPMGDGPKHITIAHLPASVVDAVRKKGQAK